MSERITPGGIIIPDSSFQNHDQDIEILPVPDSEDEKIGWSIMQNVGIGIVNSHAILHVTVCCLCRGNEKLSEVDIDLKDYNGEDTYMVCLNCCRKTRRMLKKLKKMDPRELPLFISDSNIFIRTRASNLLQKK